MSRRVKQETFVMGGQLVVTLLADQAKEITESPDLSADLSHSVHEASNTGRASRVASGMAVVDYFDSDEFHLMVAGGNTICSVRRKELPDLSRISETVRTQMIEELDLFAKHLGLKLC